MGIELQGAGDDRVDYGDMASIDGLTEFSVAISIKPTSSPINGRLASKWGGAGSEEAFLLVVNSDGSVRFGVHDGGGSFPDAFTGRQTSAGVVVNGVESKIVAKWRASAKALDIVHNGVVESVSMWLADGSTSSLNSTATSVQVGHTTNGASDGVNGDYAEFAMWGRYLSDDEAIGLTKGYAPSFYMESGLLYSRFLDENDLDDQWGDESGTGTGVAKADHPPVIYQDSPLTMQWPPVVAGGTILPFMQHYAA